MRKCTHTHINTHIYTYICAHRKNDKSSENLKQNTTSFLILLLLLFGLVMAKAYV